MHKLKYFPDVALLTMRLIFGVSILISLYPFASALTESGMKNMEIADLMQAVIFFVASIFLMLGLFTRWTSTVLVLAIIITSFPSLPPIGEITFDLFWRIVFYELSSITVPLSIWLLGNGKYALDYKFWQRV